MEEKKQAVRIQTSILNPCEKRILAWLAGKMPAWVTSDMLTFVGFLGAVVVAAGYALSNLNLNWLWLACFGFLVNWFGDSLDGNLAYARGTQRHTYGFFIDHNVDVIDEVLMFIGVGISPLVNLTFMLALLVSYLVLSVYVYIDCYLIGEHRLTHGGLGPTEFRLLAVIVNILYLYVPQLSLWKRHIVLFHNEFDFGILDGVALFCALAIFLLFLAGFLKDVKYFAKVDPPKKFEK